MPRILVILALLCAVVATILGFDLLNTSGDPHVLGWLGLALAFRIGADLA